MTKRRSLRSHRLGGVLAATVSGLMVLAIAMPALANVALKTVSQDTLTNLDTNVFHATEVEPSTFSNGSTVVADFQLGRFQNGGASDVGWATSTDNGRTWSHGLLPKLTVNSTPPGPYKRATDPSVAYDAKHGQWLAGVLDSKANGFFNGDNISVSRSTDGLTWGNPVNVATASGSSSFDSTWVACDNTSSSPHYGNCYFAWDDFGLGAPLRVSVSSDGGLTWTPSSTPGVGVIGSKPVPQPNGNVVIVAGSNPLGVIESFVSKDGGATFTGPNSIATFQEEVPGAGLLRGLDTATASGDAAGKVYVTWFDCRFRAGCSSNDIVMSTSTDGKHWTAPARIPIDSTSSTVDHVLPGITVQDGTSGGSAHVGVAYYFLPKAACSSSSTCKLAYGEIQSNDGGATWGTPTQLAGPFTLDTLPDTSAGFMVTDYSSASFVGSRLTTVFANAKPGTTCAMQTLGACNEFMSAPKCPLAATGPFHKAGHRVLYHGANHPSGGLVSTV